MSISRLKPVCKQRWMLVYILWWQRHANPFNSYFSKRLSVRPYQKTREQSRQAFLCRMPAHTLGSGTLSACAAVLQKAALCVIEPGLQWHSAAKHSCHSQLCLLSITWNSIWMRFRALQIIGDSIRSKASFPKQQSKIGKKMRNIFCLLWWESICIT